MSSVEGRVVSLKAKWWKQWRYDKEGFWKRIFDEWFEKVEFEGRVIGSSSGTLTTGTTGMEFHFDILNFCFLQCPNCWNIPGRCIWSWHSPSSIHHDSLPSQ